MTLSLPDTAVAGDSGHVADHNLITTALGTVDTHLTATTDHIPSGAVALGDVAATYTDESVGRRIFTWDTVNSRWQLTYGDTGWRDVSALFNSPWTGSAYLRRVGYTVSLVLSNMDKSTGSSAATTALPSGFFSPFIVGGAGMQGTSAIPFLLNSGDQVVYCDASPTAAYAALTWLTTDAWPASLPGTASGAIPYQ